MFLGEQVHSTATPNQGTRCAAHCFHYKMGRGGGRGKRGWNQGNKSTKKKQNLIKAEDAQHILLSSPSLYAELSDGGNAQDFNLL